MSVVIKRDHPSGSVGVSVDNFPEDDKVVLGVGNMKDMTFFELNDDDEAHKVSEAINNAVARNAAWRYTGNG